MGSHTWPTFFLPLSLRAQIRLRERKFVNNNFCRQRFEQNSLVWTHTWFYRPWLRCQIFLEGEIRAPIWLSKNMFNLLWLELEILTKMSSSTNSLPSLPIKSMLKLQLMLPLWIQLILTATSSECSQCPSSPSRPSCQPIPWTACTKSSSLRVTFPASQLSLSQLTPSSTSAAPRTTSARSMPSVPIVPFYTTVNAPMVTLTSPTRWISRVSTTFPMTLTIFPRPLSTISANSDSFVSLSAVVQLLNLNSSQAHLAR